MTMRDATTIAVTLAVMATAAASGIEQTSGTSASPVTATGADLQVPEGFRISVFAESLPGARFMTVSPDGVLLVARRRTHEVVALPDHDGDGRATPTVILTGMTNAHSLAFRQDYLYIATTPGGDARALGQRRSRWCPGEVCGSADLDAVRARVSNDRLRQRRNALRVDRLVVRRVRGARPATHDHPGVRRRRLVSWRLCRRSPERHRIRLGSGDGPDVGGRQRAGS